MPDEQIPINLAGPCQRPGDRYPHGDRAVVRLTLARYDADAVLRLPRSVTQLVALVAAAVCSATASADPPEPRALDECVQLRDTAKPREAIPHCRAAYDALPPEAADRVLHDRAIVVFETHYTYQEAQAAARDPVLMCEEAAFLGDYLAFLDANVSVDTRPADRRDAKRLLAELHAELGDHRCDPEEDELLPVRPAIDRRAEPPAPPPSPPARTSRPLRTSGAVLLGVGLLLGAATAVPLAIGEAVQRQRDELIKGSYTMGQVPEDIRAADAQLDAAGVRLNLLAGGIGAVAGAALVVGVGLLAVDAHRHRRSQRFALHPRVWPHAGLELALEF